MDTSHPVVLRPGRGRGVAFIIIGVAFGLFLAWLGPGGGSPVGYWAFTIIVMALWLGFGVYMVNPRHYLRLDARGMEIHTLRHTTAHRWQELRGFYAEGTATQPMVTYELAGENPRADAWTRVTHIVTGGREVLPNTYGLPAEELARLLNEWREQVVGPEAR
jgi:hypothetical protein